MNTSLSEDIIKELSDKKNVNQIKDACTNVYYDLSSKKSKRTLMKLVSPFSFSSEEPSDELIESIIKFVDLCTNEHSSDPQSKVF